MTEKIIHTNKEDNIQINKIANLRWNARSIHDMARFPITDTVQVCCVNGNCPLHQSPYLTTDLKSLVKDLHDKFDVPAEKRVEPADCVICSQPMHIIATGEEIELINNK